MSEIQYHNLLQEILDNGINKDDRTGTGVTSLFCPTPLKFKIDGGNNFPLLTKKQVNFDAIIDELLWFLQGSTNKNLLKTKIWDQWADEDGNLGPIYGKQMTNKEKIVVKFKNNDNSIEFVNKIFNPLQDVIDGIKNNPNSRRHVLTTWDHSVLPDESLSPQENVKIGNQALACCHGTVIQFYVNGDKLSLSHYQRSADVPIGVPFNIASYATLLMIVASLTNLIADELICSFGDAHIYDNQQDAVKTYLDREILNPFPKLEINKDVTTLKDYVISDFKLLDYVNQGFIKTPIAI